MKVSVYWSWDMPEKLEGIAVVIDVYAASSNIAAFLTRSVAKLYVASDATILDLKKQYPLGVAIGESRTLPKDTFICNNWPGNVSEVDVSGKTVLYMSNNGTRAIAEAMDKGAQTVIAAGFVNIAATVDWILGQKPSTVTLIESGEISFTDPKVMEDIVCAQALKELMEGKKPDMTAGIRDAKAYMKTVYKGTRDDPRNINLTMVPNTLPVVPLCRQLSPGIIEVTNATRE